MADRFLKRTVRSGNYQPDEIAGLCLWFDAAYNTRAAANTITTLGSAALATFDSTGTTVTRATDSNTSAWGMFYGNEVAAPSGSTGRYVKVTFTATIYSGDPVYCWLNTTKTSGGSVGSNQALVSNGFNEHYLLVSNSNNLYLVFRNIVNFTEVFDVAVSDITTEIITISSLNDRSGYGYNATQSTVANQPRIIEAVINGQPVVRFDGSSDYLTTSAIPLLDGCQDLTWFAVSKASAAHVGFIVDSNYSAGSTFGMWGCFYTTNSGGIIQTHTRTNADVLVGEETTFSSDAIILSGRSTSNTFQGWVNGTSLEGEQSLTTNAMASHEKIRLGANSGNTINNFLNGDIAEIIAYNKALTTSARQEVENYLNTKYAIY